MIQEQDFDEIHKIIQFVLEIDKLKGVLRKVKPLGEDRYENTAEHSWQISMPIAHQESQILGKMQPLAVQRPA